MPLPAPPDVTPAPVEAHGERQCAIHDYEYGERHGEATQGKHHAFSLVWESWVLESGVLESLRVPALRISAWRNCRRLASTAAPSLSSKCASRSVKTSTR